MLCRSLGGHPKTRLPKKQPSLKLEPNSGNLRTGAVCGEATMTAMTFESDGFLTPGIHRLTLDQFIECFCATKRRFEFGEAVRDLYDFANRRGATTILTGGSFVNKNAEPRDLDCLIVFECENQIPERSEKFRIHGQNLDVFFCAEDQGGLLPAFVKLFTRNRSNREVGIVEIVVDPKRAIKSEAFLEPDPQIFEMVRLAYFNRHVVNLNARTKALITVHGIRTHAEWNAEVAHIASSNGWIVAPFVYGYVRSTILFRNSRKRQIVDWFHAHLDEIINRYDCPISVIAHSFGTYVAVSYLDGFDRCPYPIDTLILTGSVINEQFDIDTLRGKVARVINEFSSNDAVVSFADLGRLAGDKLLGKSGKIGFLKESPLLQQQSCRVFDHNNVIRRDVIAQRWMPWLERNVGMGGTLWQLAMPARYQLTTCRLHGKVDS
jgi:pimeloyl-ACP methyl ester carboxylesterase